MPSSLEAIYTLTETAVPGAYTLTLSAAIQDEANQSLAAFNQVLVIAVPDQQLYQLERDVVSDSTIGNTIGFQGRNYDSSTGLQYFRARYLDATTGRFISQDPQAFQDSPNHYSFVSNNPANLSDPTGRAEVDIREHEATKLKDITPHVNAVFQIHIDKAYKLKKDPPSYLYATMGKNVRIGRTWIELYIDNFSPPKGEKFEDYVLQKDKKDTKYKGVYYSLWLQPLFPILNPGINLSGHAVGSDKLGHFVQQGYEYYLVKKTRGLAAADVWNKETEFGTNLRGPGRFGEASTGVMSAADLEANRQGGRFHEELAQAYKTGKPFVFDIRHYVSEKWDENKNPNQYVPSVESKVKKNCKKSGCQ